MSKGWIWMSDMETVMTFWWSLEMRVRVCWAVHVYERPAGVTRAEWWRVLAVCFPAAQVHTHIYTYTVHMHYLCCIYFKLHSFDGKNVSRDQSDITRYQNCHGILPLCECSYKEIMRLIFTLLKCVGEYPNEFLIYFHASVILILCVLQRVNCSVMPYSVLHNTIYKYSI